MPEPLTDEIKRLKNQIRDLEERLAEQERAYEENETRYRSLFEAAFEGIVIHEKGVIIDFNPAFARIFGYPPDELMGMDIFVVIAPEYHNTVMEKIQKGAAEIYDIMGVRKDGSPIYLEIVGKSYTYQGRPVRVAGVRDTTAGREANLQRLEQQRLAEALRDTAAFLNSVLDPEEVMSRILENVGRVVPHDAANIMLIEGNVARIRYWRGYDNDAIEFFNTFAFDPREVETIQIMMRTGNPLAIPDTRQYDGWIQSDSSLSVHSYAGAPIKTEGGMIIGFINLDSATYNALTQAHAERLQAFADQAAIAIRNARLYDQSRRQAEALQNEIMERVQADKALARRNLLLETLNELSRDALANLEEGHILDTVARVAVQAIDATSAYVCDWHEDVGTSTVIADYVSPFANPKEQASDRGVTYNIYEEFKTPMEWIRNPLGYNIRALGDDTLDAAERQHIEQYGGYGILAVPLWVGDEPVGYIEIWDSRQGRTFSKADIEIVRAIARQVSVTLNQARLHAELQNSETRTRAILNAIPDAMFRIDRNGVYRDAHLPPMTTLKVREIIGHTLHTLMPPEVAKGGIDHIRRALDTGEMQIYEYEIPDRATNERRDFEARMVVCGEDEVLVILRDITRRKRTQEDLARARDEALEASRVKSQFLANMSHELRTPLNSIINYTQLMMDGIYGEVTRTQLDRLEKVHRNGQTLLNLINDVLDLSKIEAGHMVLKMRRVSTLDFLNGILEVFAPMAEEKGLRLEYAGGDYADIQVDEARARQILTNIIGNAIKFTHEGSVTVTTHLNGNLLCFSISDTGIGIPPEAQAKIFDEFRQVDNSSTRQYEGTGLGLTISKRLAEMHGGTIWVESEVGMGSTFHITFPTANPDGK